MKNQDPTNRDAPPPYAITPRPPNPIYIVKARVESHPYLPPLREIYGYYTNKPYANYMCECLAREFGLNGQWLAREDSRNAGLLRCTAMRYAPASSAIWQIGYWEVVELARRPELLPW